MQKIEQKASKKAQKRFFFGQKVEIMTKKLLFFGADTKDDTKYFSLFTPLFKKNRNNVVISYLKNFMNE